MYFPYSCLSLQLILVFLAHCPVKLKFFKLKMKRLLFLLTSDKVIIGKYFAENRTNITWNDLPDFLVNAVVSTEDKRFYQHHGIDKKSYLRVLIRTILLGDQNSGGGSTITQQLAKNIYGRDNFGILTLPINKIKEAILAKRFEAVFSKNEILLLYLNSVPFGENVYGIEAASNRYFRLRFFFSGQANFEDGFTRFLATPEQVQSSLLTNTALAPRTGNRWNGLGKLVLLPRSGMKLVGSYQRSLAINQNTRMLQVTGNDAVVSPGFQYAFTLQPDLANTYTQDSNLSYLLWTHAVGTQTVLRDPGLAALHAAPRRRQRPRLAPGQRGLGSRPALHPWLPRLRLRQPRRHPARHGAVRASRPRVLQQRRRGHAVARPLRGGGHAARRADAPHVQRELRASRADSSSSGTTTSGSTSSARGSARRSSFPTGRSRRATGSGSRATSGASSRGAGRPTRSHRFRYNGLIATLGARLETWAAGSYVDNLVDDRRHSPSRSRCARPTTNETFGLFGLRWKARLLPKLNVSFPIRENQVMFFSYGHSMRQPAPDVRLHQPRPVLPGPLLLLGPRQP